ncbi:MAG: hypothetical protein QM496_16365 [Verrucomicrobiota bacterium]
MGKLVNKKSAVWFLAVKLAVIAFWLVTIGVLVKRHFFSDESQMVRVPPDKVFEMFFAWTEGAELTILKDGLRIGHMSLSTQSATDSSDAEVGSKSLRGISVAGSVDSFSTGGAASAAAINSDRGVSWRGAVDLDDELNFPRGNFVLRMPDLDMGAQAGFDQPENKISLSVRSKGQSLFQYEGAPAGLSKLPELGWMGRLLPLDSLLSDGGLEKSGLESWAPEISGRYGSALVAGRRMLVYQLLIKGRTSKNKTDADVTLSLSETGEPLMIQTAWGYEALAEVLVPLEVYQDKN